MWATLWISLCEGVDDSPSRRIAVAPASEACNSLWVVSKPADATSYVYLPPSQEAGEDDCRALLEDTGAALWITGGQGVPSATLLPTLWRGGSLIAHASGHNEQFTTIDGEVPCRVVVQGPDAYVSPRWYPSIRPASEGGAARGRAEGRAVGTWNYQQAQFAGVLTTYRDLDRLRSEVTELGELFDADRVAGCPHPALEPRSKSEATQHPHPLLEPRSRSEATQRASKGTADVRGPWLHTEAPADFYEAMLQGIVGLELRITEVVGRFKLSRNRTEIDRDGVAAGLRGRGRPRDVAVADAMDAATPLGSTSGSFAPRLRGEPES
jgi:transcriptional regulator